MSIKGKLDLPCQRDEISGLGRAQIVQVVSQLAGRMSTAKEGRTTPGRQTHLKSF